MDKSNFQNLLMRVLEELCPNKRFEILFELKPFLNWIKREKEKQREISSRLFELLQDNKETRTLLKTLNYERHQFFKTLKKALS